MAKREITIGRSASCDISLGESAEFASTCHGTIFWNGTQLMYKDTSTNGTVINNTMVHLKTIPINHGDTILIAGKYQISWEKIDSLLAPSRMSYQPTRLLKLKTVTSCRKCGTPLDDRAKFCPNCGTFQGGDTHINMNKKEITIGRSTSCDIRLGQNCDFASTYHGTIFWNGTQLMYKDTSTNGTVINNTMVHGRTVPINHGDTILIAGKYQIAWEKIDSFLAPYSMSYQPTTLSKLNTVTSCRKCGTKLNVGTRYCPKCGTPCNSSSSQSVGKSGIIGKESPKELIKAFLSVLLVIALVGGGWFVWESLGNDNSLDRLAKAVVNFVYRKVDSTSYIENEVKKMMIETMRKKGQNLTITKLSLVHQGGNSYEGLAEGTLDWKKIQLDVYAVYDGINVKAEWQPTAAYIQEETNRIIEEQEREYDKMMKEYQKQADEAARRAEERYQEEIERQRFLNEFGEQSMY